MLRKIRETKGHTRNKAAALAGLGRAQIVRLEDGQGVHWRSLRRVAEYYGMTVGELAEWITAQQEARHDD